MELVGRHLGAVVADALSGFRVTMVHGPRQCGKTTLARQVVAERGGSYLTLDDPLLRAAAEADPHTLLADQAKPCAIDEVQLGGDRLVRAVKRFVDDDPRPGQFLLTGSTNFLTVPTVSESLAGRMRLLELAPFSVAERVASRGPVVDGWFDRVPTKPASPVSRPDYLAEVCRGGYPEVSALDESLRSGWFASYVDTVVQRDLVALADIRRSSALPQLLRWFAGLTATEMNITAAANALGLNRATIAAYFEWLRSVFLVRELAGWSRSTTTRAVRRPKLHVADSGVAASLLGVDAGALARVNAPAVGQLLETFVVNECARQFSASTTSARLGHYRDPQGREVDLVAERADGAVIAVEVKATSSPTPEMLRHVSWLRDRVDAVAPDAFRLGVLLHTGPHCAKVGDRLWVAPIASTWTGPEDS